ncbi:MAG: hypothetical protein EHM89_10950, partial [Acidobacteria bacterium]
MKRRKLRWLLLALSAVVLVAAIAAAAVASSMYRRTLEPYKGYPADELFVEVPPGASAPDIGRRLVDAGVVRDLLTFRITLWQAGQARRLRAGEYRFDRPMTAGAVVEKISRGEVYERRVTFPE